jgi:hypothetical protein
VVGSGNARDLKGLMLPGEIVPPGRMFSERMVAQVFA